jgi:hypothetical protein
MIATEPVPLGGPKGNTISLKGIQRAFARLRSITSQVEARTTMSATVLRLAGAAAGFLSMRLSFRVLGVEGVAAVALIQAVSGWLFFIEAGTGMAAQNYVAKARAVGKPYSAGVSYLLRIPLYIGLAVMPCVWLSSNQWLKALGSARAVSIISEHGPAVVAAVTILVLQAASSSMWRIYYAEGRGAFGNMVQMSGSIVSCGLVWLLYRLGVESFAAYLMALVAPGALLPFTFYCLRLSPAGRDVSSPDHAAPPSLKEVGSFFLFNLAAALVLRVDVLMLSRASSSLQLATFVCMQRIMSIVMIWQISIQSAHQSQVTVSWTSHDRPALSVQIKHMILAPIPAVLMAGIALALFQHKVALLLTSGKITSLGLGTIGASCLYYVLRIWTDAWSTVMLAIGEARRLVFPTIVQGGILIPTIYFLGLRLGSMGGYLALSAALFATTCWWAPNFVIRSIQKFQPQGEG